MVDKTTIGIITAVVCIGLVSIAGVFLPQVTGNKTWQLKQNYNGSEDDNTWITIESDVWRITWLAYPVENFHDGAYWPVPYSYFGIHVYSYPDNTLAARGYSSEGVPLSGVDYIVQSGEFFIQIITTDIQNWSIYIYEYR